jgi:hypothetical protein
MGAEEFMTMAVGKTAQEAFLIARDEAAHECGHGGYTGTIAEKDTFVLIEPFASPIRATEPAKIREEARDRRTHAQFLVREDDARIADKWGPAGCIPLDTQPDGRIRYLFFGNAAS